VKLAGQCNPSSKEVSQDRKDKAYLLAQSGRGLGWVTRVNVSESLINLVTVDKPNVLSGLSQKGMWSVNPFGSYGLRGRNDHREKGETQLTRVT
jgi:hypothetical protein